MFLIHDTTSTDITHPSDRSRGLIPRDLKTNPIGCYANIPKANVIFPVMTDAQIIDTVNYRKAKKQTARDLRRTRGPGGGRIPSLDQDGVGYCWAHSSTMAVMLKRMMMNQEYVRLSAFMVGCIMKNYRDRGGWGADSFAFITENGVPSENFWPMQSMDRRNDTPAMRANAALHKITEGVVDLQTDVWERSLSHQVVKTVLATGGLVIGDFNWWEHSVCLFDLDIVDGIPCPVGLNSWSDEYGDLGEFTLQGQKAIIDGGVALLGTLPTHEAA